MSWQRSLPGTGSLILTPWQTGGTPGSPTDAHPDEKVMISRFQTSIFLSELTFEREIRHNTAWSKLQYLCYREVTIRCFTWSEFQQVSSLQSNKYFFPYCFTSRFNTELTLKSSETKPRLTVTQNRTVFSMSISSFYLRETLSSIYLRRCHLPLLISSLLMSYQLLTSLQTNEEAMLQIPNTNCRQSSMLFFYDSHSHSLEFVFWSLDGSRVCHKIKRAFATPMKRQDRDTINAAQLITLKYHSYRTFKKPLTGVLQNYPEATW